jgi:hypothetical protein
MIPQKIVGPSGAQYADHSFSVPLSPANRTGLRLINPDTFFSNPVDTINNFVQSTGTYCLDLKSYIPLCYLDNSVTQYTQIAAILDVDPVTLIGLLQV